MRATNIEAVGLNPVRFRIKTEAMSKSMGIQLLKSTSLENVESPASGFCFLVGEEIKGNHLTKFHFP